MYGKAEYAEYGEEKQREGLAMFAASTYKEIEDIERRTENLEIVVILFVRPTNPDAMNIIREFEYLHYNSARYCSIFAVGYTDDFGKAADQTYKKVDAALDGSWYFSTKAFVEFKDRLQKRIRWEYSGENEILILQNNPGSPHPLNFNNYVAINVNSGIREGYIDSFQRFMESLIRCSKSQSTVKEVVRDLRKERLSLKGIISQALDDCKKVPLPVKKIIKDRLFYRCANSI